MCDLCLQKSTGVQYRCSDSPLFHYNTISQNLNIIHIVSALYVSAESSLFKMTPQKFEFGAVVSFTLCHSHVRCSSCLLAVPVSFAHLWMLLCKWHIRFFIHKLYISLVTHLHLFKSNFECSRSTICPIFVPSSTHLRNDRLFQHLAVFSNTVTRNRNRN